MRNLIRVSTTEIVQIFKDGIAMYFKRARSYLEETEATQTQRITTVREYLQERIELLRSNNRQKVSWLIIADQEAGRTRSRYREENAVYFQAKTTAICKVIKSTNKREADSEDEEIIIISSSSFSSSSLFTLLCQRHYAGDKIG